jgi:ankyrin repeat protein
VHPLTDKLLKLAAAGAAGKVIELLKSGEAPFDACVDKDGNTAAHVAARYGKLEVLKALAQLTLDVGKPSNIGNTTLHYAAAKGHVRFFRLEIAKKLTAAAAAAFYQLDCVTWLLTEEIVPVHCVNNNGATALHVAAENGQIAVIECVETFQSFPHHSLLQVSSKGWS